MCDTRGRGVARGKGPEIGNEGGLHCLQNGLSLSRTECLYIRDLVLNKDFFCLPFGTLLGPCLFWEQCSGLFEADLKCSLGLLELRDKSQFV